MDPNSNTLKSAATEDGQHFPQLSDAQWQRIADALRLTSRERDVVAALLRGGQDKEIAHTLNLSSHTVHSHLDRIYRKVGVTTRCELILRVFAEHTTKPGKVDGNRLV